MADKGYRNGSTEGSGTGGQQRLRVKPSGPDTPPPAPPSSSKGKGVLSFLKNHWRKAGPAILLGIVGVSCIQTDIEHPEHSLLSPQGLYLRVARTGENLKAIGNAAWAIVAVPVGGLLKSSDMVRTGTQPLPEFIVCTNKELYDQMMAGEPRATAFARALQPQLESQARLLGYKSAPFYQKHAEFDPHTRAPAAVFHIPAVPKDWHPNTPYVLEAPLPIEQKFADENACGRNEVYRKSPIPGMN